MIPQGMRLAKNEVYCSETKQKLTLAPKTEAGLVPCPGEAHSNAFIDRCMICAPNWGKVMSYEPPTLEEVMRGFAVPCVRIPMSHNALRNEFAEAEKRGEIDTFMCETKNAAFFCWVKK